MYQLMQKRRNIHHNWQFNGAFIDGPLTSLLFSFTVTPPPPFSPLWLTDRRRGTRTHTRNIILLTDSTANVSKPGSVQREDTFDLIRQALETGRRILRRYRHCREQWRVHKPESELRTCCCRLRQRTALSMNLPLIKSGSAATLLMDTKSSCLLYKSVSYWVMLHSLMITLSWRNELLFFYNEMHH